MRFLVFLTSFFAFTAVGQQWQEPHWGVKFSFMIGIGTHQTSVGIAANTYAAIPNAQLNAGATYRFFAKNLGDRCHFGEWRYTTGLVLMAGKRAGSINMDWDGALHQSRKPYSIGYAHIWYRDKVGTSQRSGTWNIGVNRVDIQFENDVFGGQAKDRFRTGNLVVSYRDSMHKMSLGFQMWTGETRHSKWDKTPGERMPSGYRDLTRLPYGNLNHGIFYVEYKQQFAWYQTFGLRAGVDSEQIRHIFQNRLSHDLILLPKSIERNTPHYPRLDILGEMVFNKKAARPALPYYKVFLNDGLLY
jgi:hypothetical protein